MSFSKSLRQVDAFTVEELVGRSSFGDPLRDYDVVVLNAKGDEPFDVSALSRMVRQHVVSDASSAAMR